NEFLIGAALTFHDLQHGDFGLYRAQIIGVGVFKSALKLGDERFVAAGLVFQFGTGVAQLVFQFAFLRIKIAQLQQFFAQFGIGLLRGLQRCIAALNFIAHGNDGFVIGNARFLAFNIFFNGFQIAPVLFASAFVVGK